MIYVLYTLFFSLKEFHLVWRVPYHQVSTDMHSFHPDFSIVENNLATHSRLQAVRQPTWSRSWAAGYLGTWDTLYLVWSLPCVPVPGINMLQIYPSHGAGGLCTCSKSDTSWFTAHSLPIATTIPEGAKLPQRPWKNTGQCWSSPNTGHVHVCRDSLALCLPGKQTEVTGWPLPLDWGGHSHLPMLGCLGLCFISLCNPQHGTHRVYTRPFSLVYKISMLR